MKNDTKLNGLKLNNAKMLNANNKGRVMGVVKV